MGCGNRHCPACGGTRAEQWLRKHCALLLPGVVYHLVTFTVPDGLRRAIRSHPRELLELLMRAERRHAAGFCANAKWLGATPGLTALLHTWTRQWSTTRTFTSSPPAAGSTSRASGSRHTRSSSSPCMRSHAVFRARLRDALREQYPEIFAQINPKAWSLPTQAPARTARLGRALQAGGHRREDA